MLNLSGFTIAYFLVPKPHQGWRLVSDLSRLNTFLLVERFKWKLHRGLQIPPRFSPCKTLSEMAQSSGFDLTFKVKHVLTTRCLMSLIGLLASTEKMVPEGRLHMRLLFSFTSRSTGDIISRGQPSSLVRDHFSSPRVVAKSCKCDEGCRPSSQRPQYPNLYRRLKRRLGKAGALIRS